MKGTLRIALISIAAAALVVLFGVVIHAETDTSTSDSPSPTTLSGITFPIPELGNCSSKEACRAFCESPANIQSCIAFGKAHGLLNKDQADRGEKFAHDLSTTGGPGGCTSPAACRAFCEDVANIEVCSAFAKSHGATGTNIDRGEKIAAYIKAGGVMPGNCTSASSCQTYCKDFAHVEECTTFAKKVGLTENPGVAGGVPPGQF